MLGLVVLVGSGLVLLAGSVATARPPGEPVTSLGEFLDRWSVVHGGYDPRANHWVHGWLRLAFLVSRPLARWGVRPDALTGWTVWVAGAAVAAAAMGGRWALLAGISVVVSGVGDGLDGAVAASTGRATRWGYVLDSVADRVNEVLFLVAVWLAGAPAGLAVACGVAVGLLEYVRARAGNAGMDDLGTVTVGERPVRVICCAAALLGAGAAPAHAPAAAAAGLWVLLALTVVGLVQLAVAVRGALGARG